MNIQLGNNYYGPGLQHDAKYMGHIFALFVFVALLFMVGGELMVK